jgi:3-oxoacyl-[acyl-carrier protein] reductase
MSSSVSISLDGKVALITGGSRGIGAATVRLFVRAGARVVFNYLRSTDEAASLVSECGVDVCHAVQADLSGTSTVKPLVRATVERFGSLDALVGNHGIWPPDDVAIDAMTDEQWCKTVAVNLDSTFALVKHSVAQMKRQRRGGHIVLVSSTAGQRGEAGHCDYAATKGALISMVKGLSTELAPFGIYVNYVAPGWVETDMSAEALSNLQAARTHLCRHSARTGRHAGRSSWTGPVPMQPSRRLHHRGSVQREWGRGASRVVLRMLKNQLSVSF